MNHTVYMDDDSGYRPSDDHKLPYVPHRNIRQIRVNKWLHGKISYRRLQKEIKMRVNTMREYKDYPG